MSQSEAIAEPGTDLQPADSSLFGTSNPIEVIDRAARVADALARVIAEKHLFIRIQGKPHILHEGWLTLGAMLGVTPVCEWTRPVVGGENGAVADGWEARVEVRTLDGRTIGAAESECLTSEKRWAKADDYAVRSMAQTRAGSKALASVLRFVVVLRGYSGTPADEMPGEPVAEPKPILEIGKEAKQILKLYEEVAPAGSPGRKKLGKAKLEAQLRAAGDDPEKLAALRKTVEGLK